MMRRLFCILLPMFVVTAFGIAQEEDFIFFYDFNDEEPGHPPSEPWKPTAAGEIVVEDFPGEENKSVRITDNGSGGGMQLVLDSPLKGKTVSMEFKWMREESSGGDVEIFYVMSQKCPDEWSGVCIAMSTGKNGVLQYNDSGAWVNVEKIEDGVWHDLKLVMYLGENEYDFYYNGEAVARNAGFRKSEGIEGIDKFNVANVGNGGTTFVMYFDDIMLYEGTTRPSLSVAPLPGLAATWGRLRSTGEW